MIKLLLADDDPFFRNAVAAVLRRNNFAVRHATDGVDLLEKLDSVQPDLIVTDIFMPVMDGIEILRELKRRSNSIPVIAISGGSSSGNFDVLRAADMLGAERVLAKPLNYEEFLSTIRTLVGLPQPQG
jgi:two-component system chemotaxis response regulator CheY